MNLPFFFSSNPLLCAQLSYDSVQAKRDTGPTWSKDLRRISYNFVGLCRRSYLLSLQKNKKKRRGNVEYKENGMSDRSAFLIERFFYLIRKFFERAFTPKWSFLRPNKLLFCLKTHNNFFQIPKRIPDRPHFIPKILNFPSKTPCNKKSQ